MAKLIALITFIMLVINKQTSATPSLGAASWQMVLAMIFAGALLIAARRWVQDFIEG